MTDDEKNSYLLDLALELYQSTLENKPDKLMVKIRTRDAITDVLDGTIASGIAAELRDEIVPHCTPFDEERYLSLCVLAQAIGAGKSALLKFYKGRILEDAIGI